MQKQNTQEEKQEMNQENLQSIQSQEDDKIALKKELFTSKCKWISATVSFFILAGIGIFLGIYLTQNKNTAPTLKKFQSDEFSQTDEIFLAFQKLLKQIQLYKQFPKIWLRKSNYFGVLYEFIFILLAKNKLDNCKGAQQKLYGIFQLLQILNYFKIKNYFQNEKLIYAKILS